MNKKKLIEVLSIQSYTYDQWRMFAYIARHCICKGYVCELKQGNLYVTKGKTDIYPCFAAHMDTVHPITDYYQVQQTAHGNLYAICPVSCTPLGIGGDDKVGIFIALSILDEVPACKAVFYRDEEHGCIGSGEDDLSFFNDCGYVLQFDRAQNSDFITNGSGVPLSSNEFWSQVEPVASKYAYRKCVTGGLTDVVELKSKGLGISVANIACGYWNPHTENEFVNVYDVQNALDLARDLVDALSGRVWEHTYKYEPYKYEDDWLWDTSSLRDEELNVPYQYGVCIDCSENEAGENGLCAECLCKSWNRWARKDEEIDWDDNLHPPRKARRFY